MLSQVQWGFEAGLEVTPGEVLPGASVQVTLSSVDDATFFVLLTTRNPR